MKWLMLPRKATTMPTFFGWKTERKILQQQEPQLSAWLTDVLTITPQVLHEWF